MSKIKKRKRFGLNDKMGVVLSYLFHKVTKVVERGVRESNFTNNVERSRFEKLCLKHTLRVL